MELGNFEMECCDGAPQRHVAAFFGTNDDYLKARPRAFTPPPGDFEVESLVRMLNDTDTSTADDRRTAMELQVSSRIALSGPEVLAIILPEEQMDAQYVKKFMEGRGKEIKLFGYGLSPLKRTSEYQALLEQQASAVQSSLGLW